MKFRILAIVVPVLSLMALSSPVSAKSVSETWRVKGVRTTKDEIKVRTALRHLEGVERVFVTKSYVRLKLDDEKISDEKLRGVVAQAGSYKLTRKLAAKHHVPVAARAHSASSK